MSKKTAATSTIEITSTSPTLMLAFELGESGWLLGFSSGFGERVLRRKIASRDTVALEREIGRAKRELDLPADALVKSCYEAGRDGFWLHRFLESRGVENVVIDSASIEVNRRSKRAKTDRLDVIGLVDLLARHLAGSRKRVFSVLTVPSEEAEDLRHLGRELKLLKQDRTRVSNRIKGLLANQGLVIDRKKDMKAQVARLRLWNDAPLPPQLRKRLEHYVADYDYYTQRIAVIEEDRKALLRANESVAMEKVWRLLSLRGVGIETAWCYGTELFGWRAFENRKQLGSIAGLTPTPHHSGNEEREKGIAKDGIRWVRGMAIELAWGWLRFQPESELSRWYEKRFGAGSKRLRKIGIVALARKLLIALWRFVETGLLPEGAIVAERVRVA